MTAYVSKEALGLMLPGTMNHYFQDEPQYLEAPRPGALALVFAAFAGWIARRNAVDEVAGLSDAQLADIGISRADVPLIFENSFVARREQDRMVMALQAGRVAGM